MPEHKVRDGLLLRKLEGKRLAFVSTEKPNLPRWLELGLYLATSEGDSEPVYYLHTVGKSVVFHSLDSDCKSGVPKDVAKLPDDAEPCRVCSPRRDGKVRMESNRHSLYRCENVAEVIEELSRREGKLTGPGQTLLEIAAEEDPAVAEIIDID